MLRVAYREAAEVETTEVDAYLVEGEEVLSLRHPQQGLIFRKRDIPISAFMLVWTSFAAFWTIGATAMGGPFGLFGLPFLGVGLYMLLGRHFMNAKKRKDTVYALTNHRLLIKAAGSLTSLPLENLASINLTESGDDGGTITIPRAHPTTPTPTANLGGHEIHLESGVREFYGAILEAKKRAKEPAPKAEPVVQTRVEEEAKMVEANAEEEVIEAEAPATPLHREFER